ncbi:MAG: heparan-alpha-glucosaminide N-acetyltransferase domain-containing protein [Bacteroidota bacterium]
MKIKTGQKSRIHSIDATRGLVMIIMALDHVRDYMHVNSLTQSPTDLSTTTPALFFTRWITHICAPTFVFLAGTSAFLSANKNNDISAARKFLWSRGVWLIFLEFSIVNFALWFDVQYRTLIFEVIGTIGFGFIVLAMLLKLAPGTIGIIGISIIVFHGLIPLLPFASNSIIAALFSPGVTQTTAQFMFVMAYPPIPWLGIMLAGFAAGKLFKKEQTARRNIFLKIGLSALLLFVIIRLINIYGDPVPWSQQKNMIYSFLSFMNISKYPPSLLFCLATLGITFLLLTLFETLRNKITGILSTYGSVPLLYFIVHLFVIHGIMLLMVFMQGYSFHELEFSNFKLGRPVAKSGVSLATIYMIWILVVGMMYPVCYWYRNFKAAHKEKTWPKYF